MRRNTGLSPDRVPTAQTWLVLQRLLRQDLRDASRPQRSDCDNNNYYLQALGPAGKELGLRAHLRPRRRLGWEGPGPCP